VSLWSAFDSAINPDRPEDHRGTEGTEEHRGQSEELLKAGILRGAQILG
jgi:hypothetical protein